MSDEIKVKIDSRFERNVHSKAVVNLDSHGLQRHKTMRKRIATDRKQIEDLEKRLSRLERLLTDDGK